MSMVHEHQKSDEHDHGSDTVPERKVKTPVFASGIGGLEPVPVAGLVGTSGSHAGHIHRKISEAEDPLGGGAIPDDVQNALTRRRGGGKPLSEDISRSMGEMMGADLSGVRIHADSEADKISRSVQAKAFTHGNDIYFSQNTFAPGTASGDHLLAHELTHVAQQRSGSGGGAGATIGKANDPAESEADSVATSVVSGLRRQASRQTGSLQRQTTTPAPLSALRRQAGTVGPPTRATGTETIRRGFFSRLFGRGKKKKKGDPLPGEGMGASATATVGAETTAKAEETTPPVVDSVSSPEPETPTEPETKTPKQVFEAALVPATAPANQSVGASRMTALRLVLEPMTTAERLEISEDKSLMAKGRTHVGDIAYMSLLTAVGMKAKKKKTDGGEEASHHMSGAEADEFIQTNIKDYPHLKPFIETAVGAGKKADGFVATVDDDDWEIAIRAQYNLAPSEKTTTNAFVGTRNAEWPAILKADRGTASTAIHESMHRYSVTNFYTKFGFHLNEGVTEYFTRKIAAADGTPAKLGGPSRKNYAKNFAFVQTLMPILGSSLVAQETALAEMYYEGKTDKMKTLFTAAWKVKEPAITDEAIETKYNEFGAKVKEEKWTEAGAVLPL